MLGEAYLFRAPDGARDQGLPFVDGLGRFATDPALLSGDDVLSHAELATRVGDAAEVLGRTRRLVLVEAANTIGSVVGYLAALRGRHPVIMADSGRPELIAQLTRRFDPDVVLSEDGWSIRRARTSHHLHPELAVLLSTSGSTGSPKLVRLSHRNLQSNAEAIAAYLELRGSDRAMTTLPLGYCYGLSVLHSHLHAGASVVLTERSVADAGFWELFRRIQATSFAGVPHTFALLERLDAGWYSTPTLRYVTQAGGRLTPDKVSRLDRLGRAHGWQLYVMYGQTEATARMAYLSPAMLSSHPHCIGTAIDGGQLRIESPGPDGTGELVYAGPNVMMGYAQAPSDLAEGSVLTELRTGDLARSTPSGLFEIVGRRSRFAKLLGHRLDLDRVQDSLSNLGDPVLCTSDDKRLIVALASGDPMLIRRRAARLTGLPAGLVRVQQYAQLPRLSTGKPDYESIRRSPTATGAHQADGVTALRNAFTETLGFDQVDDAATFVELGGDSLSQVEMSDRLEELMGTPPRNWPEMSIRDLAEHTTAAAVTPTASRRLDTAVVLRAVSIVLIVLAHLEVSDVRGGGHLLLGVAGFSFARFSLTNIRLTDRVAGLAGTIARIALPSMVFIAMVVALSDDYAAPNIFFAQPLSRLT